MCLLLFPAVYFTVDKNAPKAFYSPKKGEMHSHTHTCMKDMERSKSVNKDQTMQGYKAVSTNVIVEFAGPDYRGLLVPWFFMVIDITHVTLCK